MEKLLLALIAASILSGCLSSGGPDPKLAELESKVQLIQAKCDAADDASSKLASSLDAANAGKAACYSELEQEKAQALSQNQSDSFAAAQAALESVSTNESIAKSVAAYKDLNSFGCFYYLGSGGFYTGSNVTIPTGCAIAFDNYIRSSYVAVTAANTDKLKVLSALDALKTGRGSHAAR